MAMLPGSTIPDDYLKWIEHFPFFLNRDGFPKRCQCASLIALIRFWKHTTYAYNRSTAASPTCRRRCRSATRSTNFNFSYDNIGNLTRLQNTAQPPGSFTGGNLGNAIGGPDQGLQLRPLPAGVLDRVLDITGRVRQCG